MVEGNMLHKLTHFSWKDHHGRYLVLGSDPKEISVMLATTWKMKNVIICNFNSIFYSSIVTVNCLFFGLETTHSL